MPRLEETGQKPIKSKIFSGFIKEVLLSHPMGSRYVCNPPVMDTDRDTLILVKNIQKAHELLIEDHWELCGSYISGFFSAYRKGIDNYVITENPEFFQRYLLATEVSKVLNIQDKETRIKIHDACIDASGGFVGLINWDDSGIFWNTY